MKSLVLTIGLLAGVPAYASDLPFESELASLLQQQSKVIAIDTEQRASQVVIAKTTAVTTAGKPKTVAAMTKSTSLQLGKIDPALLQLTALTVADISGSY